MLLHTANSTLTMGGSLEISEKQDCIQHFTTVQKCHPAAFMLCSPRLVCFLGNPSRTQRFFCVPSVYQPAILSDLTTTLQTSAGSCAKDKEFIPCPSPSTLLSSACRDIIRLTFCGLWKPGAPDSKTLRCKKQLGPRAFFLLPQTFRNLGERDSTSHSGDLVATPSHTPHMAQCYTSPTPNYENLICVLQLVTYS